MNVLVCIKQVPDNSVVPKLDPYTNRVVTEGVELMESPFDLNAVEAGLKLVEENGGEVSVLTLGGESAKTSLRYGLSMGAAKAYLLKDPAFEESDSWGTSYGLAKAIQSIGNFDVILCGKQAIDNDAGQVGPGIAEQLGISQITYVSEIVSVTEDTLTAKRVSPAGEEVVEAKLPVVLTCEKSLNEPRYPTLKRTRMANRAEIPEMDCAAVGAEHRLTPREIEVMQMLCAGRSRGYVAETLYISENTVKTHADRLYKKLGVHSREELVERFEVFENGGAPASFSDRLG